MPLIIHPSSCCDICLDTFTYNDKPPFAIPCGHIFCRSCLFGIDPSLCPLCRKPFLPERSKKLITGEVEIPEVEGIEDEKAIELLTKLVNSLEAEEHNSTILEVDLWLSAGNTHALLQKVQEILKEFFLLKSERSANLRSIRRLQRDMHRLQVDRSTEKEKAFAMEQELLSHIEGLQEKVRELEKRRRAVTTTTFNHNPLPTPPEPFPLESLPFLANLQPNANSSSDALSQRSSDRTTQNTLHLDAVPANTSAESLAAAAPRPPILDQTEIPSNPISTMNDHTSNHRNAIIPGASPNQRFIPGSMFEESSSSVQMNVHGQTALPVDPFSLATDYFTEYAAGFEEGYHLNQRYLQLNRRNRQTRRTTEPAAPSVVEPLSQSEASSSRTLDDRLLQGLSHISTTNHSVHRPLGFRDFYATSTTTGSSSNSRDDPPPTSRVSSPRPPTLISSSSVPIHGEQHWGPSESALPTLSSSPAPLVTTTSVDRTPSSYSLSSPPSVSSPSNSRQSLPSHPTSALSSNVTSTNSDTRSSRSSRTSGSSRAREQRRRSDATSIEISWNPPTREALVPIDPDSSPHRRSAFSAHISVQPSPLPGVVDSPASVHTMDSWGTLSTNTAHRVPHRPFRSAHQINSVSDLGLRLFDDFTDAGTLSHRSSLLSDVTQPFLDSHHGLEGSVNAGSHASDSQNRTPRVAPRPLPETESVSSPEAILLPFVPSRDPGRHWNTSNASHSPYHDLDHNHSQHHGTFPGASETSHRATADLTSIQSSSHAHSHSHSHSITDPVPDRSSRISRHRTTRPSTAAIDDNTTSSRWETNSLAFTNALGLTDLALSPEPRISAPTPITPSRSFLRYYNENYR